MRAFMFASCATRALLVRITCLCGLLAAALLSLAHAAPAETQGAAAVIGAPLTLPPNSFITLSYHEVRDEVRDYPDPYAVDSAALVAQFAWLRGNGYTPVTLAAIIAARNGGAPLPPKAVLLTFDDGYLSFYTRVYPLLRAFKYPALLAVVGKWIDHPPAPGELYGEKASVGSASFPSWAQLREMASSGLVEMASHTYDLHRGVPANPQGNVEPAATTRIYDAATRGYESDAAWRERVRTDLLRNSDLIEQRTGQRPKAVVWPYGSYNHNLTDIAASLGMPVAITLDDGPNTPQVPLTAMRRLLVVHNPPLADFANEVAGPVLPQPVRVVEVRLDAIYDPDPAQQEKKLSALLDRMLALTPTHVFLHAFAEAPEGTLGEAYFPGSHATMRADLLNRVAWQLDTRSDVKVFVALPPTLLQRKDAQAIVEDLARTVSCDGLYFMPTLGIDAAAAARHAEASTRLTTAARLWRAPLQLAQGLASGDADPSIIAALSKDARLLVVNGSEASAPAPALVAAAAARPRTFTPSGQPATRVVVLLDGGSAAPGERAGALLAERMRALRQAGAIDFGYRENDFLHDQPALAQVAPALSVRDTTIK